MGKKMTLETSQHGSGKKFKVSKNVQRKVVDSSGLLFIFVGVDVI
jgi:hypothetical protein